MSHVPTIERDGDAIVVRIPMVLKSRRGRKEIIVPEGLPGAPNEKAAAQEPLVTALARAFHWQELIDSGRHNSVTELAQALGLDRSYVCRVMRLTLLAPDIVEEIVAGREPSGMSLERLVKRMPMAWAEQRRQLSLDSLSGHAEVVTGTAQLIGCIQCRYQDDNQTTCE